jgi:hypothetical protein
MRFSTAWAKTAAQNVTLKTAAMLLGIVCLFQLSVIAGLSMKDPLVVERSCYSKASTLKNSKPTQDETASFLNEAIPMRFDSAGSLKEGFLALDETISREKEMTTLKQRQMDQRVLVSDVKINGDEILVTTDRLISIGKIKSVLPLNLKVTVLQTNRTESNPYGLIVGSISQVVEKEKKE